MQVNGAHSQAATGLFSVDVQGLGVTNIGRIIVTGAATLNGTLSVSFVNGYVPNIGDSFQVVSYASRTGAFSAVNPIGLGAGLAISPAYNATNLTLTTAAALMAEGVSPHATTTMLMASQLESIASAAMTLWADAGLTPEHVARLRGVSFQIADLGSNYLGMSAGNTIWLDDNANGWGWFVDATPNSDSEFLRRGNQGEQNRMDLLTAVMHEIGHILGHDHDERRPDD